ncbi:MAG: thermonuclease family protein [Planctomycetota bacterium]
MVAYLYRAPDNLLINLELVRQGLGLASEGYNHKFEEAFAAYQQQAQANRKGIWALPSGTNP